jgi:hypothetical protein
MPRKADDDDAQAQVTCRIPRIAEQAAMSTAYIVEEAEEAALY